MSDMPRERYEQATDDLVEVAREACDYLPPKQAAKMRKALTRYDKTFSAFLKSD